MNTFNKTIKITSILAVLTIIPLHGSIAAVACMARPISPTSCPESGVTQCPASGTSGNATNQDCTNLSLGDWKLTGCTGSNVSEFSGTSLCSSTSGTYPNFGNPVTDGGSNCWCKITSIPGFSVASSAWVCRGTVGGGLSGCADYCAYHCADFVRNVSVFRSALFAALGL
ncbi:MAG: hypothetical protein FWG80_01225 [Alphaproteobacteria bacterium]|nr:hypothetical protein [Alphaproteobacteria bacterium]